MSWPTITISSRQSELETPDAFRLSLAILRHPFDTEDALPVTCTTVSMDPNAMQGWSVVLKETWVAGPDYPAGELNIRYHTMADGTDSGCSFDSPGGKDSIGFPHVGKSKYGG